MRTRTLFLLAAFCCVSSVPAQTLFPQKTLAFSQVAVGPIIETIATVSNRGSGAYAGTAFLYRGDGVAWNPTVNGTPVTNGRFSVNLAPGATSTFRFTGADLDEGFLILIPQNFVQDNFVEGSLSYHVRRNNVLVDSIGILPSAEFLLATIPFENFATVALALVNPDVVDNMDATVTLRLFDEAGGEVADMDLTLAPLFHDPAFLAQLFLGVNLQRGRVDIKSNRPIFGTALTLTEGQLSALPLGGAVRSYSVEMTSAAGTSTGGASLWANSFFVSGYMVINKLGTADVGPVTYLLFGRLVRGVLRLSSYGAGPTFDDKEVSLYVHVPVFDFNDNEIKTTYIATDIGAKTTSTGNLTLKRTN